MFLQFTGREDGLCLILCSVTDAQEQREGVVVSLMHRGIPRDALAEVSQFRTELYASITPRADALFDLADAVLCTDGPVRTLVDLALAPEHRRGHGALYGGLNQGGSTSPGCVAKAPSSAWPWRSCPAAG